MKDIKITKEVAIKELKESISSIMLTTDVITFINRIEHISSVHNIDEIIDLVKNEFKSWDSSQFIQNERFEINSKNEIFIDSLDIDIDELQNNVVNIIERLQ